MFAWTGWRQAVWAVLLMVSGWLVMFVPGLAPWAVMIAVCGAIPPWLSAWKWLRNGAAWGLGLGGADELSACWLKCRRY